MHILLTDHLTCPRCGPRFGLIVMADLIEDRRVREGVLGCANCRTQYRIAGGLADLRGVDPVPSARREDHHEDDPERGFRLAALMGLTRPGGMALVFSADAALPGQVATHLPGIHIVGAKPASGGPSELVEEVSNLLVGRRLPLRDGSMRAAALVGANDEGLLSEAARLPAAGGRVVVEAGPESAAKVLRDSGLEIQLEQDGIVVAAVRTAG